MLRKFGICMGILFVIISLAGCGARTIMGKENVVKSTEGFEPKKKYNVSYDSAWITMKKVLDNEKIPITMLNKQEGRITTDYMKGDQVIKITVLGPVGWTQQHKYAINFESSGPEVSINIIATVEVQEPKGAWRPLGDPKKQKEIENWLYEKFEKALKPA